MSYELNRAKAEEYLRKAESQVLQAGLLGDEDSKSEPLAWGMVYANLATATFAKAEHMAPAVVNLHFDSKPHIMTDARAEERADIGKRVRAIAKTDREQALMGRLDSIANLLEECQKRYNGEAPLTGMWLSAEELSRLFDLAIGDD